MNSAAVTKSVFTATIFFLVVAVVGFFCVFVSFVNL